MKHPSKKKILVPVDGSDRSLNTVRYIVRNEPFISRGIVLFHVFNSVPESYWDLANDPRSASTVRQVKSWEVQQRKNIAEFMERADQLLLKGGFPPKSIVLKVQNRKKGIARDIIQEARHGYEAVVTRRRGMTGLRRIVIGSVASKMISKLTFLPLILVGKKRPNNKILLAFDGSDNALRAVDFVGTMLGEFDYEVSLHHVIRSDGPAPFEYQHIFSSPEFTKAAAKEITYSLEMARSKLVDMGFKPEKVSFKIAKGEISRAGSIADRAKAENFGTIVMGRRGHSRVPDFIIGRVTNKVIHMARDRTVWVIR